MGFHQPVLIRFARGICWIEATEHGCHLLGSLRFIPLMENDGILHIPLGARLPGCPFSLLLSYRLPAFPRVGTDAVSKFSTEWSS